MKENKTIIWVIPIIMAASLYLWIYTAVSAEPVTTPSAVRIGWENALQITNSSTRAEAPVMSVDPDGTIMVAYHQKKNGGTYDILYEKSTDQGDNWESGVIHQEEITNSVQVDIAYDDSSIAHAVWVMQVTEATAIMVYADETVWGSNETTVIYTGDSASTPEIIASGTNTLDVIWAGSADGIVTSVYHSRSDNGGAAWSSPTIINGSTSLPRSPAPVLAIDNGTLYAVWEVNLFVSEVTTGTIFYAERDEIGAWSAPRPISNSKHDAHEASILIADGKITVIYTHRESKSDQWLYLTTCPLTADCTESGNWTVEELAISGSAVGVNADSPWNVFSNLIKYDGCSYAHFHGTSSVYAQENELAWSANDCNGWTVDDEKQPLTMPEVQTVFPTLAKGDSYLYLAYQQNALEEGVPQPPQIFFQRGQTISVARNLLNITFAGGNGSVELKPDHNPFVKICTEDCSKAFDTETNVDGALETTIVRMVPLAADGYIVVNITNTVGSGTTDCGTWAVDMSEDRACTINLSPAPVYLPVILK